MIHRGDDPRLFLGLLLVVVALYALGILTPVDFWAGGEHW
jgi:hypothetical protein